MQGDKIKLPPASQERKMKIAVFVAVAVFLGATAWNVATRISLQKSNAASIGQVVDVTEQACISRHDLVVQYRVRAKNQRVLARTQLMTTQAFLIALAEAPTPTDETAEEHAIRVKFIHRYEAAVPKLKHILKTTKLLPPENCKKQAEELRANLPPG